MKRNNDSFLVAVINRNQITNLKFQILNAKLPSFGGLVPTNRKVGGVLPTIIFFMSHL
jgi:hypothetical protein